MSTSRDVEKGESDEENRALLEVRTEERQDDGVHPIDDMELRTLNVEKGESDEENRALLEVRNEVRQDDGKHPKRAVDMESRTLNVEKGESDEENRALVEVRNEVRQDGKHPNRAVDMESRTLRNQDQAPTTSRTVNSNESDESSVDLQESSDESSSIIEAIYEYNNKELISWLDHCVTPNTCPIPILAAACQAQSHEDALQLLLHAGAEPRKSGRMGMGVTPLHVAALTNEPRSIARILGFPKALANEETYIYRRPSVLALWLRIKGIPPGYTALHVASASAHSQAVRQLLAAGASPNQRDASNLTALDVAGAWSPDDDVESYSETLQLLRNNGGRLSEVDSKVLERALGKRCLLALTLLLDAGAPFDPRNPSGNRLMHLCVDSKLPEHLEVLLTYRSSPEMDYRAVDVKDEEGSTVLHWAVSKRWSEGATVALLAGADITVKNLVGDTALHLAAKAGDFDIVKEILDHDTNGKWDFRKKNSKGESPLSYAILSGNADIVKHMCYLDNNLAHTFDTAKVGDLTLLEYAIEMKFHDLFIFILDKIRQNLDEDETSNIVKLITKENLPKLFYELKNRPLPILLKKVIAKDNILHQAAKHSSREMIIPLLDEGADLSQRNEDGQTAISLLMCHLTKPTKLMAEVLDGCMYSNTDKNIYDRDCVIKINYSVLKPENENEESDDNHNNDRLTKTNDMKVLEALIATGDVHDQRSLLTHPVVESFLYLKWKKCAKFIYYLISAYVLFLISLNFYIGTSYYHMDHKINEQDILFILKPFFWRLTACFTFVIFSFVDLVFWLSSKAKWFRNKTIWTKFILTVGAILMMFMNIADNDINRGVAVVTVSLSWIYMMILLSWTPTLGYYMQMYGKVSKNVIKVMLTFSFPLVGFSIGFMILLRSKEPFDDPIAAFLKTMVMMSSEFDYDNLVKNDNSLKDANNSTLHSLAGPSTSLFTLRIFFLLFFICVAIVLMNLMLGVAVNDFKELSHDGKQRRLMKQIECIIALEKLFQRRPFSSFKWTEMKTWRVPSEVEVNSSSNIFGKEIKEIILNKAQSLRETKKEKADDVDMKVKIDNMYILTKKQSGLEKELLEIKKSVNAIKETVALIKDTSEKRMFEAVDKILEAIANDRRTD